MTWKALSALKALCEGNPPATKRATNHYLNSYLRRHMASLYNNDTVTFGIFTFIPHMPVGSMGKVYFETWNPHIPRPIPPIKLNQVKLSNNHVFKKGLYTRGCKRGLKCNEPPLLWSLVVGDSSRTLVPRFLSTQLPYVSIAWCVLFDTDLHSVIEFKTQSRLTWVYWNKC